MDTQKNLEGQEKQRLTSLIGLCRRAGRLGCGSEKIIADLTKGNAILVLLSSDCSERTQKQISNKCTYYKVRLLALPLTRAELGKACGLEELSGCSVTDNGFAKAIAALAGSIQSSPAQ